MTGKYVKHIVAAMDESMIQHCVLCGVIITDYSNLMWANSDDPPMGFGAGELYVSKGSPKITTTEEPEEFQNCI